MAQPSQLQVGLDQIAQSVGYGMWARRRHLLDTDNLTEDEIATFISTAKAFKDQEPARLCQLLKHRIVSTMFFENSTRTRSSFEIAAHRLGSTVINLDVGSSSVSKGETLIDTAHQLVSMGVHSIITRHSSSGAADLLVSQLGRSVQIINAGDGWHAHPTQSLLDLLTMMDIKPSLRGCKIAIIGDITHSRVARSNIHLLQKAGASVHVAGPPTLLPAFLADMGVTVHTSLEPAIEDCQFVMALRLQLERQQQGLIPSIGEYVRLFRLDRHKLQLASRDVKILHPGPVNRGIELADELVDDEDFSLIHTQVANGVPTRMAVLYLLMNASGERHD
jgi:aspartate carbamoyltransferase catalytic subunit